MIIFGLDPGYQESAIVGYNPGTTRDPICYRDILPNEKLIVTLPSFLPTQCTLVIEDMQMYGMTVGKEVFDSVFWAGRFAQAWMPGIWTKLLRTTVRTHLCHTARSGDAQVRQALIERFGPYKEQAIGTKAHQGPLYGLKSHCWSALALAVTYGDLLAKGGTDAAGESVRAGRAAGA